ncbi:pseudouridine synthase, TruD, partial [Kipferlia bialata]|eukprot:g5604.t1
MARPAPAGSDEQRSFNLGDETNHTKFPLNTVRNSRYRWWNFVYINLYEQFHRFMNLYFLGLACLQLWSVITPVNPITTWAPLIMVLGITMCKDLYDDLRRKKMDKEANARVYLRLCPDGTTHRVASKDIAVGDILCLSDGQEVPADSVLLSVKGTDSPHSPVPVPSPAQIVTANLDGETNLKTRMSVGDTQALTPIQLGSLQARVVVPPPSADIHGFTGRLELAPTDAITGSSPLSPSRHLRRVSSGTIAASNAVNVVPLTVDNTLWGGVRLRMSGSVLCCVTYTAGETKLALNKAKPPKKWTKSDSLLQKWTIFIFLLQWALVLAFSILGTALQSSLQDGQWYLYYENDQDMWYTPLVIPLRFFLLGSLCIPISFKVPPSFIQGAVDKIDGMEVGNFTFSDKPLSLGDSDGNRFGIVLRSITPGKVNEILANIQSIRETGFVNYFGLQRFGTSELVPTHQIGLAILLGRFKDALALYIKSSAHGKDKALAERMLSGADVEEERERQRDMSRRDTRDFRGPRPGSVEHVRECLRAARTTLTEVNDSVAMHIISRAIPRHTKSLFMHAYQGYIWNLAASKRVAMQEKLSILEGDLIGDERDVKVHGDE